MKEYKFFFLLMHSGILVALLCACSPTIPTLEESAKNTHIPKHFNNLKSPALDSENEEKGFEQKIQTSVQAIENAQQKPYALEQLETLLDDLPLQTLLRVALEHNTNVLTMVSRIKQARSQAKINTANMLPTINGGINSSYIDRRTLSQTTTIRPGANSVNANIGLSWEVDLFGKLNALRQSSKKDYLAAQSNLAYAQISLIAEVSTLYYTLRQNAYSLARGQESLLNLERIEENARAQYKLGLIDITSLQTTMSNTTTQKNNVETLAYTLEQNKNALLVLLNIDSDELEKYVNFGKQDYNLPEIKGYSVAQAPNQILLSRPDIQSNLYSLYSQLYKEASANAARLPSISLSGSIGEILYSNNGAGSLVFQIANSITAPLLNRSSLKQTYLIQKELSKEAYYTLQNTINTALSEIENALFDKDSKKRQLENIESLYALSQQSYANNKAKYERGLLDVSEFLTNENTYLNVQTQLFNAQSNEILSFITLFKALGGNFEQDSKIQKSHEQERQGAGNENLAR